jgi:hypothetical protein
MVIALTIFGTLVGIGALVTAAVLIGNGLQARGINPFQ